MLGTPNQPILGRARLLPRVPLLDQSTQIAPFYLFLSSRAFWKHFWFSCGTQQSLRDQQVTGEINMVPAHRGDPGGTLAGIQWPCSPCSKCQTLINISRSSLSVSQSSCSMWGQVLPFHQHKAKETGTRAAAWG